MSVHPTRMLRLTVKEDGTAGSANTFEDFFSATNPRLFTALWLVTGDRYEAEEIAQEAFLRVFERWDRVGGLEDPESYVFRTAMNVFRNRYRRAALAVRRSLSLAPHASDELAAVEDRDEVIRLLRPLPPRQRAAVVATSILDLSAEEAGRVLGMRSATVRALTSRARTRMKDEAVDPR
ncbi:MAG: sigma-70 family RNA polymerase sigma factor, partial [Actinomycetota bacterium]|nr:sigma-70 family RNA polymerase sigma factor [Actinomycetota bacterium]